MAVEIKIPSPGESISEVEIANWLVEDGAFVEKDQEVAEVESEKATLPLLASESGKIKIIAQTGETLAVGAVACTIDTSVKGSPDSKKKEVKEKPVESQATAERQTETKQEALEGKKDIKVTPVAEQIMKDHGLEVDDIIHGLRKITKQDVQQVISNNDLISTPVKSGKVSRESETAKMSSLRRKLSERLVAVKNETAMLTTFNEVDMSEIIKLRKVYQQQFMEKHGVKLGFMSFFTRAVSLALKIFPNVNSMIDGENIIHFNYSDIGIAVQADKGLLVPVIRNAESLSMAEIEKKIIELADKARKNRISMDDMSGGTFTITNGGLFGSMLSTPILNPPQAAILGMHNIVERPVALNGKVEIRPIMYVALSYDHRLIDGRDSVGFLVKVKELLESPGKMLYGSVDPERLLLDL